MMEETATPEVTKEMRYKSKSVNFGIIYGQGPFGLADNLNISRAEAKQLIENYFKEYNNIKHKDIIDDNNLLTIDENIH